MSDSSDNQGKSSSITWVIAGILLIAFVLFGPWLAAGIDYYTFRTGIVEDFFRKIGLHDFYTKFYDTIRIR